MKKKTFPGISEKYANLESSKIVLINVPYDSTETWRKVSKNGPKAFLSGAEHMELYDIETEFEVYKKGIFLVTPIVNNSISTRKMVYKVYKTTRKYLFK